MVKSSFASSKTTGWDKDSLATAAGIKYLSDFEKELVLEINMLRSNPTKYSADFIEPVRDRYKNKLLYYPGDLPLLTTEGVFALDECVRKLRATPPMQILSPDQGLSKSAMDHVKDQSVTGQTGHTGSDGSGFRKRIERYSRWKTRIAENIAYGGISPRQVLIYLLIDDGLPERGHRRNFLTPEFRFIGVAMGAHPEYKRMSVMEFAGYVESSYAGNYHK